MRVKWYEFIDMIFWNALPSETAILVIAMIAGSMEIAITWSNPPQKSYSFRQHCGFHGKLLLKTLFFLATNIGNIVSDKYQKCYLNGGLLQKKD